MLWPYLKVWEWEWIFGHAVKAISSLGVRSPCSLFPWVLVAPHHDYWDFGVRAGRNSVSFFKILIFLHIAIWSDIPISHCKADAACKCRFYVFEAWQTIARLFYFWNFNVYRWFFKMTFFLDKWIIASNFSKDLILKRII